MPNAMGRPLVAALMVALAAMGCGSADSAGSSTGPVATGELASALERGPLDRLPGSSFAGDDESLWYSDFEQLARYSVAGDTWETIDLPAPADAMVFVADGEGGITGLSAECGGDCTEAVDGRVYHAWRVDSTGSAHAVAMLEQPGFTVDPYEVLTVVGNTGIDRPAEFLIKSEEGAAVVKVGTDAVLIPVDESLESLCAVDEGYVGVSSFDVGPSEESMSWTGDESWDELRSEIDSMTSSHLLAGPAADQLSAPASTAEVDRLLASGRFVDVCLPNVLAIVGADEAQEMDATAQTSGLPALR